MSVAIYPVLETEISGFQAELTVSGKALSWRIEALETLAQELGLSTLMSFFSTDESEVGDMIGLEEGEALDFEVSEDWFNPTEALKTVRGVREYIRRNPGRLPDESGQSAEAVVGDLNDIETVLITAEQHGVRFHFAMDI